MKRKRGKRVQKDYVDDEQDPYVPTDSDDAYSDSDKILLEKARRGRKRDFDDSEEEVFGLGSGLSDDDDNDADNRISDSDIDGKADEDDDLPDVRAWGREKRNFYSTDYVDQDYGGYDAQDVEDAEKEEEDARAIQKRLIEQLDDADFSLDMFTPKAVDKEGVVQEVIKSDLESMSKRQKLALMKKESPEFFGLVEDFKTNMKELQEKLDPVLKVIKEGKLPASPADSYVRTKYHLILNYCMNITFYLLLKAKRVTVQSHPVVRRLYQFRQLLKQLETVDQVMSPQIEMILEKLNNGEELAPPDKQRKRKKKMLKLLSEMNEDMEMQEDVDATQPAAEEESMSAATDEDKNEAEEAAAEAPEENEKEGEARRAITYQMAKNKGLTPYRKKENRNPRVKHRNKFRKAKIRRKGQIREPRKELQKYGGEISGIKLGVVKSTKLK